MLAQGDSCRARDVSLTMLTGAIDFSRREENKYLCNLNSDRQ